MATYIQGLTDYIPQIQPFQPDLNFYGNVMQTRQSRFDAATKKINDLYGSLLYSPLSRDSNIQRREEFFRVIDNDIKRISGLDLSLKQNEDQALAVFKGFYDDKYMLADMVKTKNAQAQLQRGENFKYCTDKEKCGGQYWDQGIKKLQYKLEEFKNVSDEESLNFQIGDFDPYFDWKKEAATKAKEMGYDVKMDTPTGRWIVRDSNGKLVEGGLYNFFTSLYGDDPRVKKNYDTEAYVARKDYGRVYKDTFGSEDEAEKHYVMKVINQGMDDTRKDLSEISDKYNEMNVKAIKLNKKLANKTITAREKEDLEVINQQLPTLQLSKKNLETRLSEIQSNIDANDLNSLRQRADLSAATVYQKRDLEGLAKSLAQIKQSRTLEVNPYTKMYEQFGIDKALAKYKAQLESQLLTQKGEQDKELEYLKQGKKPGGEVDPITGLPMEGLPGSAAKEGLEDDRTLIYNQNRDGALSKLSVASAGSTDVLYKLFNAAKAAKNQNKGLNETAGNFLKQFGDDNTINNINNLQDFQKLIADKKLSSIATFNKFVTDSKAPSFDNSWAKSITDDPAKYADVINRVSLANQAFNKLMDKNQKLNQSIIDKLDTGSEGNLAGYYAKDLLNSTSKSLETKEAFINKAMKTALNKYNTTMTTRELGNIYDKLVEQFYDKYNSAENISLMQGQGLPGGGMVSSTPMNFNLDLAIDNPTTKNIIALTDRGIAKYTGTKFVTGDFSKDSFEKTNNPALKNFLNWYLHEWKNPKSAAGRTLNTIVSNIGGENAKTSAVTYSGFDPDAIKAWQAKDPTGPLRDEKVLEKGITMFFDRTKVDNPFNQPMSDAEIVLKTSGSFTDSGFDGVAGTVDYTLDGDMVTATWNKDIYNEQTGKWSTKEVTYNAFPISNLDRNRDYILAEQINQAQKNKYFEDQYIKRQQSR